MIYLVLLLQQIIAAGTHIVGKALTNTIDPALAILCRLLIVVSAFSVVFVVLRWNRLRIPQKDWPMMLLLGFINIPANQLLFLYGLRYTTAPNSALIYSLSPIFALLISVVFLKERLSPAKLLGIIIAMVGAALVLLERGPNFSADYLLGNFLILGCAITWAIYAVLGKRMVRDYGPLFINAVSMTIGLLWYLPIFTFFPGKSNFSDIQPINWAQLAYLGLVSSGLAYWLWYYALSRIEASKVTVFNNLQPVLTTLLAFMLFGSQPSLQFMLGGAIAIAGVALTQKG